MLQFLERLRKSGYDVRRRRKAPLAVVLFHRLPLRVQIERNRAGVAFGSRKRFAAGNDEGKARDTLDALVRRRDQKIDAELGNIHIHGPEGAHGVHDEAQVAFLHDF